MSGERVGPLVELLTGEVPLIIPRGRQLRSSRPTGRTDVRLDLVIGHEDCEVGRGPRFLPGRWLLDSLLE